MQPEPTDRPHYGALDGLRGMAILLVVFFHNFGFIHYFSIGWLGVDLFFVLSGYLITDILLKTVSAPNYLRNFYMRRVLRIFPLYYLSLFLFLLVLPRVPALGPFLQYYEENQAWLWTYLQNWLFIFRPDSNTHFLHHYWSLAVEEQFYIIWPLVIYWVRNIKHLLILITLLLVAVLTCRSLLWIYQLKDLSYFNLYTFSRIDGICIGSMVALLQRLNARFLERNRAFVVFFFAGLNFLFYFINRLYGFTFPYLALVGYSTFAMLFGLLVYEAVRGENRLIQTVFNWGWLKFFGRISYGFYIFHWPVYMLLYPYILSLCRPYLPDGGGPFALPPLVSAFLCTVAGIGVSLFSYRFIEAPFLRLKRHF